ncbi:MAG: ethylbenzene dehydrogenase-related protein [Nitrospinota bacterium]
MLLRRISIIAAWVFLLVLAAPPAWAAPMKIDAQLAARGKALYDRECAVCHGPSGKGDGEAAYLLFPAPRDFTAKMFKIRSTPSGEAPMRSDLVRVLLLGLPGSTMPSFVSLPESDLRALAEHVLSLAGYENEPAEVVKIPKAPPATPEWTAKGKAAYLKYECNKCHGDNGNGKGPSAADLKDYLKRPILPNDYTRGVFKGGGDPQSIMTRIMTGIEGTPMPSHAEVLEKQEDVIALAHYVRQFSKGRDFWQPGTGVIPARRSQGSVPVQAYDRQWSSVVPTPIPMMQLHNDGRTPIELSVRALHDEANISILLEWDDPTHNQTDSVDSFGDSAAIQFSIGEKDPPLFVMGAVDNLVNIWFWTAPAADVEVKFAGMAVDDYPLAGSPYPRRAMGHPPIVASRATRPPFIAAWAAGNPISAPGLFRPFMDMNAAGFGTLQPQGPKEQNVMGQARWANGKWRVVFTRTMENADKNDAQLLAGSIHPIGFAVWDGSRRDRDGQKSVTTWYKLRIE